MKEIKSNEVTLNVEGMHCKSCCLRIGDALLDIEGVSGVSADFRNGQVVFSCSSEKLVEVVKSAIRKEGYRVK
ncbi:MAG: heavy metal-associated domain-containing protein [Candidatus Micrarchaeia archaeon]